MAENLNRSEKPEFLCSEVQGSALSQLEFKKVKIKVKISHPAVCSEMDLYGLVMWTYDHSTLQTLLKKKKRVTFKGASEMWS